MREAKAGRLLNGCLMVLGLRHLELFGQLIQNHAHPGLRLALLIANSHRDLNIDATIRRIA